MCLPPSRDEQIDKAVAVVVSKIDYLAVGDFPIRFGKPNIALHAQPLALLVLDDLIGLDGGAGIVNLQFADCGNRVVGVVVSDFGCLNEHRSI